MGVESSGEAGAPRGTLFVSPNPASGAVRITSVVFGDAAGVESVTIYDASGRAVALLDQGLESCFQWDCRDTGGVSVPSGLYVAVAETDEGEISTPFVVLSD